MYFIPEEDSFGTELAGSECQVVVDLEAIRSNLRLIAARSGKSLIAVVKANAYGHGMLACSRAALEAGAEMLAVARLSEALQLRQNGINAPVLIFGRVPPVAIPLAIRLGLRVTLYDPQQIAEYAAAADGQAGKLPVHIKIDTGMGRLGVIADQSLPFIKAATAEKRFDLEGFYSHFSKADETDPQPTQVQIQKFNAALERAHQAGIAPRMVHLSNSAGSLFYPQNEMWTHVRAGIAMYGLNPSGEAVLPPEFRPALSWKTVLASVKNVPRGQKISYGGRYEVREAEMRIGVLMAGYADGFRRTAGNAAVVRGKKVPVIGTVCMDQCMVDLSSCPDAQIGDEVCLIGGQKDVCLSADDLAACWGTINYEVTSGISTRIKRIYQNSSTQKEGPGCSSAAAGK